MSSVDPSGMPIVVFAGWNTAKAVKFNAISIHRMLTPTSSMPSHVKRFMEISMSFRSIIHLIASVLDREL
jgi:hypothetical protein